MVQVSGPTRLSLQPRALECRAYEDSQLSDQKESCFGGKKYPVQIVFPWVLRTVKIKGH